MRSGQDEKGIEMSAEEFPPPLTEPLIVPCLYVTGLAVEIEGNVVRVIGWTHVPAIGGETEERRITVRFTMPMNATRRLRDDLNKKLGRREH